MTMLPSSTLPAEAEAEVEVEAEAAATAFSLFFSSFSLAKILPIGTPPILMSTR